MGENIQAPVTKSAAGGHEVTKAWTNVVAVLVTEQVKLPVSTRTQISEKCRDAEEEVFVCWERVKRLWVDESVRLWKVGAAGTVGVWEVVG